MTLRLAFMGTPEFAAKALQALITAGHDITCVYSQPPKPANRGQHLTPSPVHLLAEQHGIEVRTPRSLKNAEEQEKFQALNLDFAVVAAYGLILPKAVLDAPKHGCLNIHASLLPRWRGAAPIQRAILAGDDETGITIMQMDEGLDTGAMLLKRSVPITGKTTAPELHDALADLGARMIVETLQNYPDIVPQVQPEDGVTYAHKLTKEDGRIDWNNPADVIDRQIRALNPWPSTWFVYGDETIKVLGAEIVNEKGMPGTLIDQDFTIACGDKSLRLLRVQRAGKAPVSGGDFLRGFPIANGTLLQ